MKNQSFTIAVASDHAGYQYKEKIKDFLEKEGYRVTDFGTDSEEMMDYPLTIRPAAEAVANGICDVGVIFGGSGNGEAIVANKVKGIRCAVCWNVESARFAKEHNNANIISMGQRMISSESAIDIVKTWLSAQFQEGRHLRRISLIDAD